MELLDKNYTKDLWKQTVDESINSVWKQKVLTEASEKSSLRLLNVNNFNVGKVHHVWQDTGYNLMAIKKAGLKAKLMSNTYVLQANRAKFNQYRVNPLCCLCESGSEDLEHFILLCSRLSDTRRPFLDKISVFLQNIWDIQHLWKYFRTRQCSFS